MTLSWSESASITHTHRHLLTHTHTHTDKTRWGWDREPMNRDIKSNRYATSNAGLSQRVHFVDTRPDNDGDWGVCLCTWLVMGNWMRDRCGCSELRWEWSLWLGGGGAWPIRYTRWRSPIGAAQHSNTWLVFAVPVPVCYRNPPSSPAPPI